MTITKEERESLRGATVIGPNIVAALLDALDAMERDLETSRRWGRERNDELCAQIEDMQRTHETNCAGRMADAAALRVMERERDEARVRVETRERGWASDLVAYRVAGDTERAAREKAERERDDKHGAFAALMRGPLVAEAAKDITEANARAEKAEAACAVRGEALVRTQQALVFMRSDHFKPSEDQFASVMKQADAALADTTGQALLDEVGRLREACAGAAERCPCGPDGCPRCDPLRAALVPR